MAVFCFLYPSGGILADLADFIFLGHWDMYSLFLESLWLPVLGAHLIFEGNCCITYQKHFHLL